MNNKYYFLTLLRSLNITWDYRNFEKNIFIENFQKNLRNGNLISRMDLRRIKNIRYMVMSSTLYRETGTRTHFYITCLINLKNNISILKIKCIFSNLNVDFIYNKIDTFVMF